MLEFTHLINSLFSLLLELTMKLNYKKILFILIFIEVINISLLGIQFYYNGFLSSPFVWDKNDTLMDFYNPLYWVLQDAFYTTYKSVYPPINYYFFKLITVFIKDIKVTDSFKLRELNIHIGILITIIYSLIILIVINIGEWKKIIGYNLFYTWFVFLICFPVLYAFERGNNIFIALLFLGLYMSTESKLAKSIFFGILVNIKPYFGLLLLQHINIYNKNIKLFFYCILSSLIILIIPSVLLKLNIFDFLNNYQNFGGKHNFTADGLLSFPNTINSLVFFKKLLFSYKLNFIYAKLIYISINTLELIYSYSKLFLIASLIFLPMTARLTIISLIVLIANFSHSTSGYVYIIYIVLIPYLYNSKKYKKLLLFIVTIFFLPLDFINIPYINTHFQYIYSFLGNKMLYDINLYIGIGTIIRPIANCFLMCCLVKINYDRLLRLNKKSYL